MPTDHLKLAASGHLKMSLGDHLVIRCANCNSDISDPGCTRGYSPSRLLAVVDGVSLLGLVTPADGSSCTFGTGYKVKTAGSVNGTYSIGFVSGEGWSGTLPYCKAAWTDNAGDGTDFDEPIDLWGVFALAWSGKIADPAGGSGYVETFTIADGPLVVFYGTLPWNPDCRASRTFSNIVTSPCFMPPGDGLTDNIGVGASGTVTLIPCTGRDTVDPPTVSTSIVSQFTTTYDCLTDTSSGVALVSGTNHCSLAQAANWQASGSDRYITLTTYYGEDGSVCTCGTTPDASATSPAAPDRPLACPSCGTCATVCPDIRVKITSEGTYAQDAVLVRSADCHWQYAEEMIVLSCINGVYTLTYTVPAEPSNYVAVWQWLAGAGGAFDTTASDWIKVSDTFPYALTLDTIACITCPTDFSSFCNTVTLSITGGPEDETTSGGGGFDITLTKSGSTWTGSIDLPLGTEHTVTATIACTDGEYVLTVSGLAEADGADYVWKALPNDDGSPPFGTTSDWIAQPGTPNYLVSPTPVCATCPDVSFTLHQDGDATWHFVEDTTGDPDSWTDDTAHMSTLVNDGTTWTLSIYNSDLSCESFYSAPSLGLGTCPPTATAFTLAFAGCDEDSTLS